MTAAELHEALHKLLAQKLSSRTHDASPDDDVALVEDLARAVMQIATPTLVAYAEARALLDQTLALVNPKEFRTSADQDRIRQAREFLMRNP